MGQFNWFNFLGEPINPPYPRNSLQAWIAEQQEFKVAVTRDEFLGLMEPYGASTEDYYYNGLYALRLEEDGENDPRYVLFVKEEEERKIHLQPFTVKKVLAPVFPDDGKNSGVLQGFRLIPEIHGLEYMPGYHGKVGEKILEILGMKETNAICPRPIGFVTVYGKSSNASKNYFWEDEKEKLFRHAADETLKNLQRRLENIEDETKRILEKIKKLEEDPMSVYD